MITYEMLIDPRIYSSIGAVLFIILLTVGYFKYTEVYKNIWKWIVDIYDFIHHTLIFVVAAAAGFSAASVWTIIYQPEITERLTNGFPEIYNFYVLYGKVILAVFLTIFAFEWAIKWISHHFRIHSKKDRVKVRGGSTYQGAYLGVRIEEVEMNRQKDMQKLEKAHADLRSMISGYEKALHRTGDRVEENPVPPAGIPERRKEVKIDPAVPPTEEDVEKILPLQILAEAVVAQEIIPEEEAELKEPEPEEKEVELKNPTYGKIDTFVLEKVLRIKQKRDEK